MKVKSISILGCGWLGLAVGQALVKDGVMVKGSTTSPEKLARIEAKGIHAFLLQVNDQVEGDQVDDFFDTDVLLLNIPPGRRRPDVEMAYPKQIQAILAAAKNQGQKVLFVSSTSVYPNTSSTVTEETPVAPPTASGRALVQAEQLVQSAFAKRATILRMAGLAGGTREPGRFFAGKTELKDGAVPVNFVHQVDCVNVIKAILAQGGWGYTFNVCADEHPLKRDFYPVRAKLKGFEVPSYQSNTPPPAFKIVSNTLVKEVLKYEFVFADPIQFP